MSRIFNIRFTYSDRLYNALLTLNGDGEASLRVTSLAIEIILPHGKLSVPINMVVNHFASCKPGQDRVEALPITDTISLQLLAPG